MSIERLIEMANDIGAYFETERDDAKAIAGIRLHIERFWEPRMRQKLLAYGERPPPPGDERLSPRVRAAVAQLTLAAGTAAAGGME